MWAAEKLGLTGADADAYAKEFVMADFEEAGNDDVFRKLRKDFDAKGIDADRPGVHRTRMKRAADRFQADRADPKPE